MIALAEIILPGICWGGGLQCGGMPGACRCAQDQTPEASVAKLVEGSIDPRQDPSTIRATLDGPPPHEIVGRIQ